MMLTSKYENLYIEYDKTAPNCFQLINIDPELVNEN